MEVMEHENDTFNMLGSLMMVGFEGLEVNDKITQLIRDHRVGTILLSMKNFSDARQAKLLIRDLQKLAHRSGHEYPLLIAIDQENGCMNSILDPTSITQFPSAMGMVNTRSPTLVRDVARATAKELSNLGINWILGPVLDVLSGTSSVSLGVRILSDDPQEVRLYGTEYIKGYQEGGVATCGKHFPSFGKLVFQDGSSGLPSISESLEELRDGSFIPFKQGIVNGLDAVMVGACPMPNFDDDDETLACLSPRIVQEILRDELDFDGIVLSECLEVESIHHSLGIGQATTMALSAGCDIVSICTSFQSQLEAISAIRTALDLGFMELDELRTSANRVNKVKRKRLSWDRALQSTDDNDARVIFENHRSLSIMAYQKSVKIIRDQTILLPLGHGANDDECLVLFTPLIQDLVDFRLASQPEENTKLKAGEMTFQHLGLNLARRWPGKVLHSSYSASGFRPMHEELISQAQAIVVVTAEAVRNTYQFGFTRLVMALANPTTSMDVKNSIPCVVVAVSSPYDFLDDPKIPTYMCTYDYSDRACEAVVSLMFGDKQQARRTDLDNQGIDPLFKSQQTRKKFTQSWLVENFDTRRDSISVQAFLRKQFELDDSCAPNHNQRLFDLVRNGFHVRPSKMTLKALLVRNSSTQTVLGVCIYSVDSLTQSGTVEFILVDQRRRRNGIGTSLYRGAVRLLLTRYQVQKIYLGAVFMPLFGKAFTAASIGQTGSESWGWSRPKSQDEATQLTNLVLKIMFTPGWKLDLALLAQSRQPGRTFSVIDPSTRSAMTEPIDDWLLSTTEYRSTDIVHRLYAGAIDSNDFHSFILCRDTVGKVHASLVIYTSESSLCDLCPVNDEDTVGVIGTLEKVGEDETIILKLLALVIEKLQTSQYRGALVHWFGTSMNQENFHALDIRSYEQSFDPLVKDSEDLRKFITQK